jgi:phosphoglycerate dehydrogenase-like enzyme
MKFLIYPAVDEETLREFQAVSDKLELFNVADEQEALAMIGDVEAMYGLITPALLEKATKLRWIQTPIAGLERHMFPALMESEVTLSNMRGIYSDHIADHVMGYITCFARSLHIYIRRQLERTWQPDAPVIHLADQTLGIIGLGGIGLAIARRAAASDMRVIAIDVRANEKPDFVTELWGNDRLNDLLAWSDFVVSCVPHTPETVKLIRAEQFRRMKKTAHFINISRGVVVDLADLTEALQQGQIAGAALDVFEIEPLPADHPLWGMANVIITPHSAGQDPHVAGRRLNVVKENIRRFLAGEPLKNVVDKRHWH